MPVDHDDDTPTAQVLYYRDIELDISFTLTGEPNDYVLHWEDEREPFATIELVFARVAVVLAAVRASTFVLHGSEVFTSRAQAFLAVQLQSFEAR